QHGIDGLVDSLDFRQFDLCRFVLPVIQRALRHRHPPFASADLSARGTVAVSPRPRSCESPSPLPLCFSAPRTAAPLPAAAPSAAYPPGETKSPAAPLLQVPFRRPARI